MVSSVVGGVIKWFCGWLRQAVASKANVSLGPASVPPRGAIGGVWEFELVVVA